MSKNLRGYSGTQVQINLDEINANSIIATNGNFTNLTIGTYTITTLNVSDLVASGVVKFTGITQQNPLNQDDHNILIHDPTTNRLYKFNSLQFSPINNKLSVHNLDVNGTLNAASISFTNANIVGNLDVGGNGQIDGTLTVDGVTTFNQAIAITVNEDNTDNNNRQLLFKGANSIIHGDTSLLYNPNTNLLTGENATFNTNLTVGADGQIDGTFTVDGITTLNSNTTINKLFITNLNSTTASSCSIPLKISTGELKKKINL